MSACIECLKRDLNLADARQDMRKSASQMNRANPSAATRAKAVAAHQMLGYRKAEHAAHQAIHEDAA